MFFFYITLIVLCKSVELSKLDKMDSINKTEIVRVSSIKPQTLSELIMDYIGDPGETYRYVRDLEDSYPNFYKWYHDKVLKELKQNTGKREILLSISDVKFISEQTTYIKKIISGIVVLKNYEDEKKICTFRVMPKFYHNNLSIMLMEESLKFLQTQAPMITISENRLPYFKNLLEKYNFKLSQHLPDYYKKGFTEYVYNGKLK